ncbi:MAG: CPXCG motif-containing cysteine-rich protein [Gammaproteobacteria bacterium]|nr:CPXCG motif-containing cysteine-rich protein [Gammaproteobacteria bacterium]
MNLTDCATADCPYCGETIELVVDCSVEEQSYIEDCPVCCRPMTVWVQVDADGGIDLQLRDENS